MAPNSIFYEMQFDTPKGKLNIVVDAKRIVQDTETYTAKLLMARKIPLDQINISPADPLVIFISDKMKWIEDKDVIWTASERYKELASNAQKQASMLAITRVGNKFDFEPEPYVYDDEEQDDLGLEGDIDFPEMRINILNPVERRLKQMIDVVASKPSIMNEIEKAINIAFISLQREVGAETDDEGFQVRGAGGTGNRKNGGVSVQPKVKEAATST